MSDNSLQAPSPEYLAELLPQYGVEFLIAQGGMGAVYKARQLSLDRDVAIKVLLYEFGEDEEFRESFTTEAKAMARLNHPNLLGVYDYGHIDGMPYIVMEYVNGGSLHEAAWNQAIDPPQAVAIVKGICDGLAHAHEYNIVHRDIKPSNILLTPNAEPKVADFGLAHAVDSDMAGLVMGTPGYTAPEVFHDPGQAGQLADIYSVGVILHQLLTGIDPAGSFVPPTHATGMIRLDAIWRKATHITPTQRYPSIVAMVSDLEKWAVAQRKAPAAPTAAKSFHPPKRPLQTSTDGGGMFPKLLVAAVLIVGIVVAYQMLQDKKQETGNAIADLGSAGTEKVPTPAPVVIPEHNPAPFPEDNPDPAPADEKEVEKEDAPPVVNSEPEDSEPEETDPDEDLQPGDPALRERAIGLILDARKKRDAKFAENARSLLSLLDARARSAKPEDAEVIVRLKGDIVANRIPITEGIAGIGEAISSEFENALTKESSIVETHLTDLTRIRNAYATRLEGAAAETADEELKKRLLAQAEAAKDLGAWIALLAPEPKWEPKRSSGGGFVGKWINRSYNSESQWIAHPDGRMEIVGETWKVTWKILEDGSLEIDWNKKAPYRYKRDGNGWIGTNPHGGVATLTQGDL